MFWIGMLTGIILGGAMATFFIALLMVNKEEENYYDVVYKLECLLCHATGGRYSKAGYSLKDMCQMVDEYIDRCIEESEDTK